MEYALCSVRVIVPLCCVRFHCRTYAYLSLRYCNDHFLQLYPVIQMKRKFLGEVAIKVDFGCPCCCHGVLFLFFWLYSLGKWPQSGDIFYCVFVPCTKLNNEIVTFLHSMQCILFVLHYVKLFSSFPLIGSDFLLIHVLLRSLFIRRNVLFLVSMFHLFPFVFAFLRTEKIFLLPPGVVLCDVFLIFLIAL